MISGRRPQYQQPDERRDGVIFQDELHGPTTANTTVFSGLNVRVHGSCSVLKERIWNESKSFWTRNSELSPRSEMSSQESISHDSVPRTRLVQYGHFSWMG